MLKKNLLPGLLALASLMVANGSAAALITPSVALTGGTAYTTGGISGLATTGYDMAGTLITATFADGSTETLTWAAINQAAGRGGASAVDGRWSLSMSGDSNLNPWVLELATTFQGLMVGLFIDLRPASALFDVVVNPEGSPGSSFGSNIGASNGSASSANWMDGPSGLVVDGTYSNQLSIGNTFYGDLYLTLGLGFSGTQRNGLGAGDLLIFRSDTDRLATAGDLVISGDNGNGNGNGNGGNPVPVPGTLALLGLGLLGLGVRRRRE